MNDDSTEKRMAGDYEIIQAVQIGDREVVLGENPQDETGMKYMCAFCRQNALFAEYSEVMAVMISRRLWSCSASGLPSKRRKPT